LNPGGSVLTDTDIDNISAFALRMEGLGLSRTSYLNLRKFFQHKLDLDTEYLMYRRMEILSGIKPALFDMCSNSCCLFAGPFADHTQCTFCGAPRFLDNGKPLAQFSYLPIIPRIQAWFNSLPMINHLNHHNEHVHIPGEISDIFDGSNYQTMLDSDVVVDGVRLLHKLFSDHRDIPLRGSTDGFQVSQSIY
jgi:hypothetical protein